MEFVLGWAKQIFAICIFMGIMIHLVPGEKYEHYVRFAGSTVLILVCVGPIVSLLTGENKSRELIEEFDGYFRREIGRYNVQMGVEPLAEHGNSYYEGLVIEYIEKQVLKEKLYPVATKVVIDWDRNSETYGVLQKIDVEVTDKKTSEDNIRVRPIERIGVLGEEEQPDLYENPNVAKLKEELASYYGINPANVNIYGR